MEQNKGIYKICKICDLEKPNTEFTRNIRSRDGRSRVCKLCSQSNENRAEQFDLSLKKKCIDCGEEKELTDFTKNSICKFGRMNRCRPCDTNRRYLSRLKRFGLTPDVYAEMVKQQDNKCLICQKIPSRLCVDHSHTTGKVRALLCNECNAGLGRFQDNVQFLQNAIEYIKRFGI